MTELAQWLPNDHARITAIVAAVFAAVLLPKLIASPRRLPWFVPTCAIAAAALSAGYIWYYLRGGPRIIDASAYFVQARAISEGFFSWPLPDPDQAVVGRFMLRAGSPAAPTVISIFPPGYPTILAIGFLLKSPLMVGPVLAAGLVLSTAALMRCLVATNAVDLTQHEEPLVRGTALLSAICATLRYHTADTMAHGLAALCVTIALIAAIRIILSTPTRPLTLAGVGGLACGWLFATRPASALALGFTLLLFVARTRRPAWSTISCWLVACLPGLGLWFLYQYQATGSLFDTAQSLYYATSDGPPACFRYGFGAGIGCLGEHGDFVRNSVGERYGLIAALGTTLRRLKMHISDALNFAPLFLLLVAGAILERRLTAVRVLTNAIIAQLCAYAPFYFDGNYPGGGARMLADILPLEHVLAVIGARGLLLRRGPTIPQHGKTNLPIARALSAVVALSLLGFAIHTGHHHAQLRERDGGRPMYEPEQVSAIDSDRALLFFDTDHGFNLAYHPRSQLIARGHHDALDRLVWERVGRPPAYRYQFTWASGARAQVNVKPIAFDPRDSALLPLTIEGESLWPSLHQEGAWAWPQYTNAPCTSRHRSLAYIPSHPDAKLLLKLPGQALAGRSVTPVLFWDKDQKNTQGAVIVSLMSGPRPLHQWHSRPPAQAGCEHLAGVQLPYDLQQLSLRIAGSAGVSLDRLRFTKKR